MVINDHHRAFLLEAHSDAVTDDVTGRLIIFHLSFLSFHFCNWRALFNVRSNAFNWSKEVGLQNEKWEMTNGK